MAEKVQSTEETAKADAPAPTPPKRGLGHRGADPRDTAAELAARAHQISLEAGSKMSGAMRDLIHAAAGISGFVVETARDVVQFMVRRGQMAQDEAERLIREAEEAYTHRLASGYVPGGSVRSSEPAPVAEEVKASAAPAAESVPTAAPVPEVMVEDEEAGEERPVADVTAPIPAPAAAPAAKSAKPATKSATKAPKVEAPAAPAPAAKPVAKTAAKEPAAKTAAKAPAAKTAVTKTAVPAAKPAAKAPAKPAAKTAAKAGSVKAPTKAPAKAASKPAPASKTGKKR